MKSKVGINNLRDITYAQLVYMITNSLLTKDYQYRVTDYQTVHRIPNTSDINTGALEPLIVKAIAVNKIADDVISENYPEDTIYYDYTLDLAEDGTTPRNGLITYRKDNKNNLSFYYDWREYKFRRFGLDMSETIAAFTGQVAGMTTDVQIDADVSGLGGNSVILTGDGATDIDTLISNWNTANPANTVTLTSGDGTQVPDLSEVIQLSGGSGYTWSATYEGYGRGDLAVYGGVLYYCYRKVLVAGYAPVPYPEYWAEVIDLTNPHIFVLGKSICGTGLSIDITSYTDYNTFNSGSFVGVNGTNRTTNIVFIEGANNVRFGAVSAANTFLYYPQNCEFNDGMNACLFSNTSNYIRTLGSIDQLTVGFSCSNITINSANVDTLIATFVSNAVIGSSCSGNLIGQFSAGISIGSSSSNNVIAPLCSRVKIGDGCNGNLIYIAASIVEIDSLSIDNLINIVCSSIRLGVNTTNNTIGESCSSVVIGDGSYNNTMGNGNTQIQLKELCYDNIIGDNCSFITLGELSYTNVIGDACLSNTFNGNASNNTLGAGCAYNKFGDYCNLVTLGSGSIENDIAGNTNNITLGSSCLYNSVERNSVVIVMGDDNQYNKVGLDCLGIIMGANVIRVTVGDGSTNQVFDDACNYVTVGKMCDTNTFGYGTLLVKLGDQCRNNVLNTQCTICTFGDQCNDNTLEDNDNIYLGDGCVNNTFVGNCLGIKMDCRCQDNYLDVARYCSFGESCSNNTLYNGCTNIIFDRDCYSNDIGQLSAMMKFGQYSQKLIFADTQTAYKNVFQDGISNLTFAGFNAIQEVLPTQVPDGGTFTITFDGNTTAAIAYNADDATIEAATYAAGIFSMAVVGDMLTGFTVEFILGYAKAPQPLLVIDATSLTIGGVPVTAPSVTTTQTGVVPATCILGDYHKEIFAREDGTYKLKYLDNTDNYQIVDPLS